MERTKTLSTGPKLVLVAAPLLLVSLFLTWQKLEIVYVGAGRGELLLDGWELLSLLIAPLTLGVLVLVVLAYLTDVELSEDIPWERLILAGGAIVFALTLLKNLTDAGSTWQSYVGVVLAGLVAVGAFEIWAQAVGRRSLLGRVRRRGISSTA